tara:strand:+ start:175 stop:531 length:357 start_codon:yes stop_codon:yes gene_type:complete
MKYEIKKESNKITVNASVKQRNRVKDPIESVDTKKILDLLVKEGYNVEKYMLEKEDLCTNYKKNSPTEGEWIFKMKEVKSTNASNNRRQKQPRRQPSQRGKQEQKSSPKSEEKENKLL